jgi:hypothetical protein
MSSLEILELWTRLGACLSAIIRTADVEGLIHHPLENLSAWDARFAE